MIRSLLVAIILFLFFVVLSPLLLILWVIGKFSPDLKAKLSMHMVRFTLRIIAFVSGIRMTVEGRENIPDDVPVLYIGNHRSFFDVVIAYCIVKGECGFVSKMELKKIPFLRRWMTNIRCLFLDRTNPREGLKTIKAAIETVQNGHSMWIYPEGTRNKAEVPLEFKEGSMRVAEKTGCPIIPVAMTGTSEIFEKHFPWIRASHVTVKIGEPIMVNDMTKEERKTLGAYTRSKILEMLPEEYKD